MSVAHIGKLQENTAALCKMAMKPSGYALSEDPDMSNRGSSNALFSHPASGCETSGEVETSSSPIRHQALNVKYPDGMLAEKNSGCETSGWNVGVWTPDDGAIAIRITPSEFPKRTRGVLPYSDSLREKHTTLAIITSGR